MKFRSCKKLFSIALRAEFFGVLIAMLPVGLFVASTVNNGGWIHHEPSIELASSIAMPASKVWISRPHIETHDSIAGIQDGESEPSSRTAEPRFSTAIERSLMDEVDQYLWAVYERSPTKQDSTGDFTWKDVAAALHLGMPVKTYVIGGMDPDLRELLYHAGLAMDAAGIHWTILSAFRDDYRQSLASGLKAHINNSLHGGSAATGGYGHGCAVDIRDVDGNSNTAWQWLDKNSAKIGLQSLLPHADPAHVQPRGAWHGLAVALRNDRLGSEAIASEAATLNTPNGIIAAPSNTESACISLRHWEGDSRQAKNLTSQIKPKALPDSSK